MEETETNESNIENFYRFRLKYVFFEALDRQ